MGRRGQSPTQTADSTDRAVFLRWLRPASHFTSIHDLVSVDTALTPKSVGVGAASRTVGSRTGRRPMLFDRRRWIVGMSIVMVIAFAQALPALVAGQSLSRGVIIMFFWLVAAPTQMVALSVTFDRANSRKLGPTTTLAALMLVAAIVGAVISAIFVHVAGRLGVVPPERGPISLPAAAAFGMVFGLLQCGVWALAFAYPYAVEQSRAREIDTARLELEANQLRVAAELARLRSQLEPHFLLNTLNAIAGLVTHDPREARRLIGSLGDLFRDSLADEGEMQTLSREVAWLQRYAEVLEARHGAALRFHWEISNETSSWLVPRLLLQPLVENAVKHGALSRSDGGRVTVRTYVETRPDGPRLVCVVEDNGRGLHAEPRPDAVGLRAVRRRLELKYSSASLELTTSSEGTKCIVVLPQTTTQGAS
jgi:signal transduction histidine kinase